MNFETDQFWHKDFLVALARRMKPKCFLELGLGNDPVLDYVASFCSWVYGVDNSTVYMGVASNCTTFAMSTDDFFASLATSIPSPELVFIDADHSRDQALKDFVSVAAICAPNCVVVLHDTFPESEPYTASHMCGDSFLVPPLLNAEYVTLPCPPGITICRLRPESLV